MVVIYFDQDILDLTLHADADASCKWCLETAIDICWKELGRYGGVRQRAKGSPEKETGRLPNGLCRLGQILIGSQAAQRLYIVDIDHGAGWNQRVAGRNNSIEPVDADEQSRRKRAGNIGRSDLRISQIWGDAKATGKERCIDGRGRQGWNAKKAARI